MHGGSKKVEPKKKYSTFKAIEKVHPHKMILYLALFGTFIIFVFMTFAYSISNNVAVKTYVFPKIFTLSTIILLFSGYTTSKLIRLFQEEKLSQMKDFLAASLSLFIIFSVCQFIGWMEMNEAGFYDRESAGSFLIVISTLHIVFMIAGTILLFSYLFKVWKLINDPVKTLITGTNPYEKTKLEMFSTFWYCYISYWLLTFLFFLFYH